MSKLKIVLVAIVFSFLLFLSEAIYVFNNSGELSIYTIKISGYLVNLGYPKTAFKILEASSNILYKRNREIFAFDSLKHGDIIIDGDGFYNIFDNYIKTLPQNLSELRGKYDLTRVFYELSLIAYNNGYTNMFSKLMVASIGCNPTLSFPIVELSNYYFSVGDINGAEKILTDCTKVSVAKQHCIDYTNGTLSSGTADLVGFLKDTNKHYYDSDLP